MDINRRYEVAEFYGRLNSDDVVVDDYQELLWRLRALYGIKNFLNTRIVALGGPWGKYSPEAPDVAREKYKFSKCLH